MGSFSVRKTRERSRSSAFFRRATREGVIGLARVVLSSRERPFLIEPMDRGLRGVTLRFSNEVRSPEHHFSEIPQMKLPPEMMKLAQHIIRTKSAQLCLKIITAPRLFASCAKSR